MAGSQRPAWSRTERSRPTSRRSGPGPPRRFHRDHGPSRRPGPLSFLVRRLGERWLLGSTMQLLRMVVFGVPTFAWLVHVLLIVPALSERSGCDRFGLAVDFFCLSTLAMLVCLGPSV